MKKKNEEERLKEICEIIKNAEFPLSIKELMQVTELQRTTLIPFLQKLEEMQEICKFEESTQDRFERHRREGLHSFRGRKQNLYKAVEEE